MKLYDEAIKSILGDLDGLQVKKLNFENSSWEDVGEHNLILRGDMAYELGGQTFPAVSGMAITCDANIVDKDEVLLIGPDLNEIKADAPYARIALVKVNEQSLGDGNDLYNAVRKIEYVRYHVNPKGYMVRISASNGREPVRVAKDAIDEGMTFAEVGNCYLKTYHENKNIDAVKLIFITLPDFDYNSLSEKAKQLEAITGTIDHIFKNIMMDCGSCGLKQVCDEVEGLRELHFSQTQQKEEIF